MITLDNFESCVPYRILVRGEEYYDTDAVSELEETSPGEWTATVEGTDDYNVEISMNGKELQRKKRLYSPMWTSNNCCHSLVRKKFLHLSVNMPQRIRNLRQRF